MQDITCSTEIKEIFLHSKDNEKFLLLSILDSAQILWVVKVQGKEKEFWDLIQLSIPYGVTIKGLAMNNDKDSLINGLYLVNKKNELDRREMISNCFWILSFKITKDQPNSVELKENSIEIDLDHFINSRTQKSLKNHQLIFNNEPIINFNKNYVRIFSTIQQDILINNQPIMNEEDSEREQIDIDDMTILIEQIGMKINCQEGYYKQDWKVMQRKYSNYIKDNSNSIEFAYMPIDNNIHLKPNELSKEIKKKKHFTISLNYIFDKDVGLKELVQQYKGYTQYIHSKMIQINLDQESNISSYSININNSSFSICLIYSIPKEIKHFTTALNSQSNYYRNIFSLNTHDCIAYSYLANHLDYLLACAKSTSLSTDYFFNIHQHIKHTDSNCIIKGDYLTSLCHFEDKSYGTGYRAIQTVISWYYLNNNDAYPHLTIPTLQDIKQALLLLGEISSNDIDKPYDITINQLSQVMSLLIDLQSESTTITHNQQSLFIQELERCFINKENYPSPMIITLGPNAFFTVIGYNKEASEILTISHEYIGKLSLINLIKMKTIQWSNIKSFLSHNKRFEYLKFLIKDVYC